MKSSDQDGLEALATLANTCFASSMSEVWDKADDLPCYYLDGIDELVPWQDWNKKSLLPVIFPALLQTLRVVQSSFSPEYLMNAKLG